VRVAGEVTNQAAIDKWMKDDNRAIHYLYDTCDEEQQQSLLTCETSHAIWSSITSQFQQGSIQRRHALQSEFLNYKYNNSHGVRAHVEAVKLLSKQIKDAGGESSDESICNRILTSLPKNYNNFMTAWESTVMAERTLANLTTRLCTEEERNQYREEEQKSSESKALYSTPSGSSLPSFADPSTSAALPRGRGRGRGRRFGNRSTRFATANQGQPRRQGRCWHCDYSGHWMKDCRFKKQEEEAELKAKSEEAKTATLHSNQDVALVADVSTNASTDLYLDSGATQHICTQRSLLTEFKDIPPGTKWIGGIAQGRSEVLGQGNMKVNVDTNDKKTTITFQDALYAPRNGINLISVGRITANGADILFKATEAIVSLNGKLLFKGRRVGQSLYRIDVSAHHDQVAAIARPLSYSIQEWHQRLAHINYATIIKTASSGAVIGLTLPAGAEAPATHCHDCAVGKMKRCVFHNRTSPRSTKIGQLIVSDVCGPMQVKSFGGAQYYVSFKDDCSGFRQVRFIQSKSDVAARFMEFVSLLHAQTGQLVAVLRSDNGGEYEGNEFQAWLKKKGIRHETTVRYTPQQNGISERDNRTIVEGARTILYSNTSLPLMLWAEAVNYVVFALNRTLSTNRFTTTPFEAWYGRKPDVSEMRQFGSEFYVLIPTELRRKLDPAGMLCYFVGNSDTQKGCRFYDPASGKVNTSRDSSPVNHHYQPRLPTVDVQNGTDIFPSRDFPTKDNPVPISHPTRSVRVRTQEEESTHTEAPVIQIPRRSTRERKRKEIISMKAVPIQEEEPDQYQDAIHSESAPKWIAAAKEEYRSLMKNKTWILVPLPPGCSLIRTRWTFKIKPAYKATETVYRARYVVKGYSQRPGIDFTESETYAPVVKHDSLRALLSIAATLDLELHQLDVKTAFLYGDLDHEIYIEQPEGFIEPGNEHLVCLLKKPLYGLIQAARKWNEKFDSFITELELTRSSSDPCIYFHIGEDPNDITILGIWVDDAIIATRTKEKALSIVRHLESHFEMRSKQADLFIGLEITRDRAEKKIYVSQANYIKSLLRKFGMTDCNPSSVPADPFSRLTVESCPGSSGKAPLAATPYRSAVGGLMYAAKMTRPDILFAVISLSRYNQDPGKAHWEAAKRVLSYLSGTIDFGLCFGGTNQENLLIGYCDNEANLLVGYCDADFGGCPDTRRSTSGLIFTLNGGPIAS